MLRTLLKTIFATRTSGRTEFYTQVAQSLSGCKRNLGVNINACRQKKSNKNSLTIRSDPLLRTQTRVDRFLFWPEQTQELWKEARASKRAFNRFTHEYNFMCKDFISMKQATTETWQLFD